MTYEQAIKELETLLAQLQETPANIDLLRERVARAETLIATCREQLRGVETDVEEVLKKSE